MDEACAADAACQNGSGFNGRRLRSRCSMPERKRLQWTRLAQQMQHARKEAASMDEACAADAACQKGSGFNGRGLRSRCSMPEWKRLQRTRLAQQMQHARMEAASTDEACTADAARQNGSGFNGRGLY